MAGVLWLYTYQSDTERVSIPLEKAQTMFVVIGSIQFSVYLNGFEAQ